jgi:hypothetical protein
LYYFAKIKILPKKCAKSHFVSAVGPAIQTFTETTVATEGLFFFKKLQTVIFSFTDNNLKRLCYNYGVKLFEFENNFSIYNSSWNKKMDCVPKRFFVDSLTIYKTFCRFLNCIIRLLEIFCIFAWVFRKFCEREKFYKFLFSNTKGKILPWRFITLKIYIFRYFLPMINQVLNVYETFKK